MLIFSIWLFGVQKNGTIHVTVTDNTGRAVPGAYIWVNKAGSLERWDSKGRTDEKGAFSFETTDGNYFVAAGPKEAMTVSQRDVRVEDGKTVEVTFKLSLEPPARPPEQPKQKGRWIPLGTRS